jgi:hypothetical protein
VPDVGALVFLMVMLGFGAVGASALADLLRGDHVHVDLRDVGADPE